MATNPYEVEHNISAPASGRNPRRPDMSTFTAHLHQIAPESSTSSESPQSLPHTGPTPVDVAALFRLVQDQLATLSLSAPSDANREFLAGLSSQLEADVVDPPDRVRGVTQTYLDGLERVSKAKLKPEDTCPICAEAFLDDKYPLVVELPCGNGKHRFMLECVAPWLLSKGNCPLCRKDLTEKKKIEVPVDDSEEEYDMDVM